VSTRASALEHLIGVSLRKRARNSSSQSARLRLSRRLDLAVSVVSSLSMPKRPGTIFRGVVLADGTGIFLQGGIEHPMQLISADFRCPSANARLQPLRPVRGDSAPDRGEAQTRSPCGWPSPRRCPNCVPLLGLRGSSTSISIAFKALAQIAFYRPKDESRRYFLSVYKCLL